jgi:hypothetical protein
VEKSIQNRFLDSAFGFARNDGEEVRKMNQQNPQPEKQKEKPLTGQEQYNMLRRCSDNKDITEWNEYRKQHPDEDILLDGRNFKGWWLEKVNFMGETVLHQNDGTEINYTSKVNLRNVRFDDALLQKALFGKAHLEKSYFWHAKVQGADFHFAHLENADLGVAHFENCDFSDAILENANLTPSELNGTEFSNTDLRGCSIRACLVDGSTRFWNCRINRYSKGKEFTDLTGTALNNVIITPGEKQLFEYNIRRQNWEEWYKEHSWLKWLVKPFWGISDYGISTKRIIFTFFGLAILFAAIYSNMAFWFPPGIVSYLKVEPHLPLWHYGVLVFIRPIYFSIVTMTTLGFGDMYANAQSIWGHILLTFQVILGYVLLGALVTRFAVLFTAGGPAGKFADEKEKEDKEN